MVNETVFEETGWAVQKGPGHRLQHFFKKGISICNQKRLYHGKVAARPEPKQHVDYETCDDCQARVLRNIQNGGMNSAAAIRRLTQMAPGKPGFCAETFGVLRVQSQKAFAILCEKRFQAGVWSAAHATKSVIGFACRSCKLKKKVQNEGFLPLNVEVFNVVALKPRDGSSFTKDNRPSLSV